MKKYTYLVLKHLPYNEDGDFLIEANEEYRPIESQEPGISIREHFEKSLSEWEKKTVMAYLKKEYEDFFIKAVYEKYSLQVTGIHPAGLNISELSGELDIKEENGTYTAHFIPANEKVKYRLLAKFFSKARWDQDPDLNKLYELEDFWREQYNDRRSKMSFSDAELVANEAVINKVLS